MSRDPNPAHPPHPIDSLLQDVDEETLLELLSLPETLLRWPIKLCLFLNCLLRTPSFFSDEAAAQIDKILASVQVELIRALENKGSKGKEGFDSYDPNSGKLLVALEDLMEGYEEDGGLGKRMGRLSLTYCFRSMTSMQYPCNRETSVW